MQSSVELKFVKLLESKLKSQNNQSEEMKKFSSKGFSTIQSSVLRCPRNLIADNSSIVNLEVFRTSKEAFNFAKASSSIGLWCNNISICFEYINALPNARQIWINSSHGITHPKIPFYINGQTVCDDPEYKVKEVSESIVQVANNVQFLTTFSKNTSTFKTVVIPFGESFAN